MVEIYNKFSIYGNNELLGGDKTERKQKGTSLGSIIPDMVTILHGKEKTLSGNGNFVNKKIKFYESLSRLQQQTAKKTTKSFIRILQLKYEKFTYSEDQKAIERPLKYDTDGEMLLEFPLIEDVKGKDIANFKYAEVKLGEKDERDIGKLLAFEEIDFSEDEIRIGLEENFEEEKEMGIPLKYEVIDLGENPNEIEMTQ